jgi:hypothetical protein
MKNHMLEIMAAQNGMVPFYQYYSTSQLASQLKDSVANHLLADQLRPPNDDDSATLPAPCAMDFSNKNPFDSRLTLPNNNHLRTRSALAATTSPLDITLDFVSCMDNFPPLDQLEMFMHLVSALHYRIVEYPSWEAILQLRYGNQDVSLLDHPFLLDLNKAEVLAIRRASLGPNCTFDSNLHKQALQRYDSGLFASHLLAKCLHLTLNQKGCQAIQNNSSIRHTSNTPYLLQDDLWVFVWIVWAIMPSQLCYKSVVTSAKCKLKLSVPIDQRTVCHYRAFLDEVSCFSQHSQDLGSLFLKMFGSPQQWIDLIWDSEEIWTQNSVSGPSDRTSTICALLKGESLTAFETALEDVRVDPDPDVNALQALTIEHIGRAMDQVSNAVFPHCALEIQKLWMVRGMKKPYDLLTRKTAAAITKINNCLPVFPLGSPASKFTD